MPGELPQTVQRRVQWRGHGPDGLQSRDVPRGSAPPYPELQEQVRARGAIS